MCLWFGKGCVARFSGGLMQGVLEDCSVFGNFVITLIHQATTKTINTLLTMPPK
jgi:hypothetical protein